MHLFLIFLLFPFLARGASVSHTRSLTFHLNKCNQRQCQQFCDEMDNGRYEDDLCGFLDKEGLRCQYCQCNGQVYVCIKADLS
ncbi:unnamed protein product [Cylicocyclus nassatus]|uniref:Uncharacterized protein n=1 Tax=Cylicocyclus nassatus TaxID=53992 RepID=A0AA36DQJ6_CYLNA|nr:unnamed protein product [Cylicocyclus nassatus]